MRVEPRRLLLPLLAAGALLALAPLPASAVLEKCQKAVDKATLAYAQGLVKKAAAACKKTPGGTCFDVSAARKKEPSAKKLKKCEAADIQQLFGRGCVSRDPSCETAAVTTTDELATCLKCSVKREVACLTATTFSTGNIPAGCVGSPSGAFLDPEDDPFTPDGPAAWSR
jgi:hypothetical protein